MINLTNSRRALLAGALLLAAAGRAMAAAPAPAGYETFNEPRVFARYTTPINGYDVRVMILPAYRTWRGTCRAIISFTNAEGTKKIVHDGWRDTRLYDEDTETLKVADGAQINLTYSKPQVPACEPYSLEIFSQMPFVFHDIDFDGKDELLLNLAGQAQRWSSAYEIAEMEPDRLYSVYRAEPFTNLDDMTIIDPSAHTLTLVSYIGGGEDWQTVYRITNDADGNFLGYPQVTKDYTDIILEWGRDDDQTPVYRRIHTRQVEDSTGWLPLNR